MSAFMVDEPMGRIVRSHGRVVPAAVFDERQQAAAERAQARALLAEATATATANAERSARAQDEARAVGFEEGQRQGRDAVHAEASALMARAVAEAEQIRQQSQRGAIALARRMAEKLVGHAIECDPTVMADIAERALAEARVSGGRVVLSCHPTDLEVLRAAHARLLSRLPGTVALQIESDPTIEAGGCVIDTAVGRLDARLATQLDALEAALATIKGGGARGDG